MPFDTKQLERVTVLSDSALLPINFSVPFFFFSCPFSFFGVVSDAETGSYLKVTPLVEDFSYSGMIYFKLFLNPSLLKDIHNLLFSLKTSESSLDVGMPI